MESSQLVSSLIDAIEQEEQACKAKIHAMNMQLFTHAIDFSDYRDLYCLVKRKSKTQADFNQAMLFCRDNWLRRQA